MELTQEQKSKSKKLLWNALSVLLVIACVIGAYFLSNALFMTIPVSGTSMVETVQDGDNVILFKPGKYRRGDVVVFNTHVQTEKGESHYIKRIIALPGDTVEIKKEGAGYFIFVNDVQIDESYLGGNVRARESDVHEKRVVPDGCFYFCGDNRVNSLDSRSGMWGKMDSILGRVILKYDADAGFLSDLTVVKRVKA